VIVAARLLLICLLALLPAAAPPGAHAQSKPDPTKLREELPLDPSPTPGKTAAPRERTRVVADDEGPSTLSTVSLMVLAAGLGAMAASLARGMARSRSARSSAPRAARPPAPRRSHQPVRTGERAPGARAPGEWQSCRVRLWQGYIGNQFYAESPGGGAWLVQSPIFNADKGRAIEDSEQAAEAFDAFLDELIADGWEITGGTGSWDVSLRRRIRAPRPAQRQPVE
jgi:hypothetical protein